MTALEQSTPSSEVFKTRDATYFTLRTEALMPRSHRPLQNPEMFCNGRCTEATCFEDLCRACLNEWHDWNRECAE